MGMKRTTRAFFFRRCRAMFTAPSVPRSAARPKVSYFDRWMFVWFISSGITHLILEGAKEREISCRSKADFIPFEGAKESEISCTKGGDSPNNPPPRSQDISLSARTCTWTRPAISLRTYVRSASLSIFFPFFFFFLLFEHFVTVPFSPPPAPARGRRGTGPTPHVHHFICRERIQQV